MHLIAYQVSPPLQQEGLPFWIFWLLLFIIFLLVLFIFLRDKKLRLRLSFILAGPRRRSILLRLRLQLKKEKHKRHQLLRRIGARVWDEDICFSGSEDICAELWALNQKKTACQIQWDQAFNELEKFHGQLEESIRLHKEKSEKERTEKLPYDQTMKQKKEEEKNIKKILQDREMERLRDEIRREKGELRRKIEDFEDKIREIEHEGRDERRDLEKEIRLWEKKKEKLEEIIKETEEREGELFLALGKIAERRRVENNGFDYFYTSIKSVNQRIITLEHRIQTLSGS